MTARPSVATQLLYAALSTGVAIGVSEGVVRVADQGALPQLDCYADTPAAGAAGATILLVPGCARVLILPNGGVWTAETDGDGLRRLPDGPPGAPWLVVGDSHVFGMNAEGGETFVAGLRAAGVPARPVGVAGHGVADALDHARRLRDGARGVLVLVNGANDWAEEGLPVRERYRVEGGWLLSPDAAARFPGRFFASPLARSHLLTYSMVLGAHDWGEDIAEGRWRSSPWGLAPDERAAATASIARDIRAFALENPDIPTRVAILPVDFALTEARARAVLPTARLDAAPWAVPGPWSDLRAALADVPTLELTPFFRDPTDFLEGDFHLSRAGHAKMTRALLEWLPAPSE
ncbi:MAG: hypothetical protein Q8P18_32065 [Pseudomonadota bacterium]|nr:hypothetical protein [Pseudomonadota bacterium]